MSKARLDITALLVDHQTPAEVAARYGVHRAWVYKLKAHYEAEGEAAFEPRSRDPKTTPTETPQATVERVLRLRAADRRRPGRRCGHHRLALAHRHHTDLSRATIDRILVRAGAVTPGRSKRPKSSYLRFEPRSRPLRSGGGRRTLDRGQM